MKIRGSVSLSYAVTCSLTHSFRTQIQVLLNLFIPFHPFPKLFSLRIIKHYQNVQKTKEKTIQWLIYTGENKQQLEAIIELHVTKTKL